MAAEGGSGAEPPAAGGTQDWLKLSSFDAASFFQQQQQEQERLRVLQGQQLQAAADMLLPSSSDEESSSESEAAEEAQAGSAPRGDEQRHRKKRRREGKDDKKRRRDKGKHGAGRRQRESERDQQVRLEQQTGAAQRAPQVKAWASASSDKGGYYFDSRGDPANLAFGGLYRMDVALYRRFDPSGFAAQLGARRRGQLQLARHLATEADGHAQRDRAARYFGAANLRAERSTRIKRWRRDLQQPEAAPGEASAALLGSRRPPPAAIGEAQPGLRTPMSLPSLTFLSLRVEDEEQQHRQQPGPGLLQQPQLQQLALSAAEELAAEQAQRARQQGETNEEAVLRRTREFNAATRQRPHDVRLWLEFAKFQDEALRLGPARRGGERGAAEKKIAILEKALSLHPGSVELLLALLKAAESVCDDGELNRRWLSVLARHRGSPRLWRAYLRHRRARFAGFSAVEVALSYDHAFDALHNEHRRLAEQGAPAEVRAALEAEAAGLAVEGALLRLAAGATERAVAAVLVLLEYNWFAPEGWPEEALEAMFEEFWRSDAPMVGQAGGVGWAAWIAGEPASMAAADESTKRRREREKAREERRQQQRQQEAAQQQEAQGAAASGWEELAPAIRARFGHALRLEPDPAGEATAGEQPEGGTGAATGTERQEGEEATDSDDAAEEEPEPVEETDEQLLERLGMNLEAALNDVSTTLTPPLLDAWLALERERDERLPLPRRKEEPEHGEAGDSGSEDELGDDVARGAVYWRDVRRLLWRFESEPARQQLLAGCLRLLGAPLPGALPSNSPAADAAAAGADELWQAAAAAGCHPGRPAGDGSSAPGRGGWVAELLTRGDWGWLLGGGQGEASPPGLRQQPWYLAAASCQEVLCHLLAALLRAPGLQTPALAEALLAAQSFAGAAPPLPARMDFSKARAEAKRLLAEQRTNLALWQAYAQLEVAAGSAKSARKVFQTCFATVGAPTTLATASAAASLVLCAVQLEMQQPGTADAALPFPGEVAPAFSGASLLPALLGGAPDAAVARAARQLAWLGSGGTVALPAAAGGAPPAPLAQEEAVAAKRGYQDHLLAVVRQQQLTAEGRALVVAAAAFEQVYGRQRGEVAAGAKAALAICDQVLSSLMPEPPQQQQQQHEPAAPAERLPHSAQLELLTWQRCRLAADAARAALPCAPPRAVRETLLRALRLFPASAALLQLLVAHEAAGHTLTQLRRELHALLERHPSPQAWLAMVAVEVTTHSPAPAVQATLERAVASDVGRGCPLLWRCYLRFEAHRTRRDAVRRVFLRAIGACPWSKAVWCDGLALMNGHVPPKELSDYLEIMKDKELTLRADPFEVLLAQLDGGGGGSSGGGDG